MPQKTNLNVNPYYEDFDVSKNFYKILFRPGYSIQGRELTQLQSILQNQIESFGKYAFKQGQLVIPGEIGLNTNLDYVKLSSVSEVAVNSGGEIVFKKYDISQLVGQQVSGLISGVVGTILAVKFATETTADTIYVNYLTSGNSKNEKTFRQGETLEVIGGINTPRLVVGTDGSVLPTSISITNPDTNLVTSLESTAMGYASSVNVAEGIYFINGYFVRNNPEILVISDYYDQPSAKIGFVISENIVTPEQDSSLYDNAIGSSNYTSPGAHRLSITLTLKQFELSAITDKNFIQLLTVKDGSVQQLITAADYSLLEETLARRTYDESGDYVVNNFAIDVREYAQKDNNNGLYSADSAGLYNNLTTTEASRKMIASIGPGKAYIKGYEIVKKQTEYLEIGKAKESLSSNNVTLKSKGLPTFVITNTYGSLPLNKEGSDLTSYPDVFLYSTFNDGSIGLNGTELPEDYRQTLSRRGLIFNTDDAIKTITIQVTSTTNQIENINTINRINAVLSGPSDPNIPNLGTLYFIKTRSDVVPPATSGAPTSTGSVRGLSYAIVNKPLINQAVNVKFLEVTVVGKKSDLEFLFLEYDNGDIEYKRKLYMSESDAQIQNNELGFVVDYRNSITPVIGRAKPNNFFLAERGAGFNSDSDIILSKGRLSGGSAAYNAAFGVSYFDPQFFTKITLQEAPVGTDPFRLGKYIVGLTSAAYGVVEGATGSSYSTNNILFVKTLSGKFLPGETIRDESGSTVKIAEENTISHFITQNRGTGYSTSGNVTIQINGLEYDSSKIQVYLTGSGSVYKVIVNSRSAVNVKYSQPPAVIIKNPATAVLPGQAAAVVPVLFKDTVVTYSPQNVKSLGCAYGSGGANTFSADILVNNRTFSEIKSVTDYTFSGSQGTDFLESTSFSADASILLTQGDIIQFSDSANNLIRAIVQYATTPSGSEKTRVYLDTVLPRNVFSTIVRLRPIIKNPNSGTLLYSTGSKQVGKISAGGDDTKIKYYFRRDFVTTASSGGGTVTFAAQLPFGTQRFAAFSEENYIITVLNKGDAAGISTGDIIYVSPDAVEITSSTDTASGLTSGSISLQLPSTYFGVIPLNGTFPRLKLTATVEVTNAKPRLKTVVRNKRIIINSSGDRVLPLRGIDADNAVVDVLSYSDCFKLRYIYEGTNTQPPEADSAGNLISGADVTERFTFDDGQRDTVYDVSRIVLKPGFEQTTGQLLVAFDYFEHSQGDLCTIDSYLHEAGVTEEEIPLFNSSVLGNIELKNVLDFRPKVDSDATIAGFQDTSSLSITTGQFSGLGSVIAASPAPDTGLEYTFSFNQIQYLDRIDGIFLNKKGNLTVQEGNSSLNPTKPNTDDDSVALFYVYVPAFTKTSKDVRVTPVDNRRYTMKDIGKLEKRLERLEYYTTLSILEQQALNMQVKDTIGMDRFKSGFFVDNFESHKVGNLTSIDYQCAVDTQQSVLRPQSKEDNFLLKEVNTRQDQRIISGYKKSGDIISLPYTELRAFGNPFAFKKINPNPSVVIQYVGDANISPNIDHWYDQNTDPIVVDTNTTLFNIFLAKEDPKESFSSLHNSFIVNWVGSAPAFAAINSLGEINSQQAASSVAIASTGSSSNISPQNNDVGKGVQSKSVRGNIVSTALSFFVRSVPVKYTIRRMKPNTLLNVFLEGRNIGRWTNPDLRFTGMPGNSLSSFNGSIVTDENGNASGLIIIPAGFAPNENAIWTGDVSTVDYDISGENIKLTTGELTFRFTTSSTNESIEKVDSFTEVKYYAVGILPENPPSIVATSPSYFKSNEGVQIVGNNTANPIRPNPLSQTFKIQNFDGGMFATGIDLFFAKKSSNVPVKVYITDTSTGKPGKNIVPGAESTLNPNTYLKCYSNGNITVTRGENFTGVSSAASGPLLKIIDKNGVEIIASSTGQFSLTNEQVYTIVLSNHNGKSFQPNEDLSIPSVILANATGGTTTKLTIAKNSGKVSDIRIKNPGINYDSALLTIESPQLPGGSGATARIKVFGGKVYNAEISLSGFGYTEPPAVVVKGVGNGASGCEIDTLIEIDTPAVQMGVCTDRTGVTNSTTPTKFNFAYPIYLQNDTEYTLVVETDSVDYEVWASKLGDIDISTSTVITTQPSLGSVYRSQNVDNWTEDIFEDLKFNFYRAEFDITRPAELILTNQRLGYELLSSNPYETNAASNTNATSKLFKNNNTIISVNHRDCGFETSGKSYVFFRGAAEVAGITADSLNNSLFKISNSGVDVYNITSSTKAAGNSIGGSTGVYASYNRKYETLYPQVHYINVGGTTIEASVKTTNIVPVDSTTTNYVSYSQSDYEKTFLNETHYFTNQKVLASPINEVLNSVDRSLTYKIKLTSTVSYLSPIIDLSSACIKTVTNRIESATGKEDRFGRRDQIIEFYPVYSFQLSGGGSTAIQDNQTITGKNTKATGTICKVEGSTVSVRVKTSQFFEKGEGVVLGNQLALTQMVVISNPTQVFVSIPDAATVIARNPSALLQTYDNIITGKTVLWNNKTQQLFVTTDVQPINNDFNSRIRDNAIFNRNATVTSQISDIFRVGDFVKYPNQPDAEKSFWEVGKVSYRNGVNFVSENTSKNSSSVAKYVTKEVAIGSPGTSIDVRITATVKDVSNVQVLYRFKKASSQENFEDIDWVYFNTNGEPNDLEIATSENSISGVTEKQSAYQEFKYSAADLPEFSSFAVKIVMKSVDPVYVPKVQDIRAVASF